VSANISSQDLLDNEYEALITNFYKKKTKVEDYNDPVMQRTTTTEFFFN
jgi:hypothetical protein